jgi:hypothetical protein
MVTSDGMAEMFDAIAYSNGLSESTNGIDPATVQAVAKLARSNQNREDILEGLRCYAQAVRAGQS